MKNIDSIATVDHSPSGAAKHPESRKRGSTGQPSSSERGTVPKIEVLHDASQIETTLLNLISEAKSEVLLMIPTSASFDLHHRIGVFDLLREHAVANPEVEMRVLAPSNSELAQSVIANFQKRGSKNPSFRKVQELSQFATSVTSLLVDRSASFIIEQASEAQSSFKGSVAVLTRRAKKYSVLSHALLFESIWHESELKESEAKQKERLQQALEREQKSRKEAELLQDILTHDVRNYNQMTKLSAELIAEELAENLEIKSLAQTLLSGVEKSTELVENAKKLGKILSAASVEPKPINLCGAIERAINKERDYYAAIRKLNAKLDGSKGFRDAAVHADENLTDVLENLISNSLMHSEGDIAEVSVFIDGPVAESGEPAMESGYWRISIEDHGKGIPDEQKSQIFNRYLEGARGNGLGMSIVHALVVGRYRGKITVRNRVPEDYTKGTVVELLIPYARSDLVAKQDLFS